VEVLKAYSHTPERLDHLRKAVDITRAQGPGEPDDTRNEAASRPHLWAMSDRLSHEDAQTIIDLYRGGMIAKDLAAKYGISLSSVRRPTATS
jgi:DNA-directed RNA polymerase specialized sigma24 family protein